MHSIAGKLPYNCVYLLGVIIAPFLCGAFVHAQAPAATGPNDQTSSSALSSARSSEAPLYPSRAMRDKTLVAAAAGDQAHWLDTEYGKLLVFYRPTEARQNRGVLILFHSAEDPQSWPSNLENLRISLPRYGWETLAVTLPQAYPPPIPERTSSSSADAVPGAGASASSGETSAAASSAANSSSAQLSSSRVARDVLIQAHVEAAMQFLQQKGRFNAVLLVDNSSALPVLQHLLPQIRQSPDQDTVDGPIQALVLINLQRQEQLDTAELAEIFGQQQLPVLDVFLSPDNAEQRQTRDLHRAIALRQKLDNYFQLVLDNQAKITEADRLSFLAGRVRGFMQKHASGTEVKGGDEKEGAGEDVRD